MYVHIERQPRPFMAAIDRLLDLAHIARYPRNAKQTRFLIQNMIELPGSIAAVANQINQNSGINGAAARAHHDALEWSEAHGCVDALSIPDRGQRSAIPEVACDQPG